MTSSSINAELTSLFEQRQFQSVLDVALEHEVNPSRDPGSSNIVAAALFQMNRYADCLLWCEGLAPSLSGESSFASMYGAVLRRLGRLDEAEIIFKNALELDNSNAFLKNNFANLLIDRQSFEEAEKILVELTTEDPSYTDARENLNRLKFQKSLAAESPNTEKSSTAVENNDQEAFSDPLLAAFSDKEVKIAGGLTENESANNKVSKNGELNQSALPTRNVNQELQETLALARQSIDSNPAQVLVDIRILHEKLGAQAAFYLLAGEAYIQLRLFADAETALLTALALGSHEPEIYLNLSNLSAMRGDQVLGIHWLELVAQKDPNNEKIDSVRKTLFPNGIPKKSSNPFQLNLDQRAPGHFE